MAGDRAGVASSGAGAQSPGVGRERHQLHTGGFFAERNNPVPAPLRPSNHIDGSVPSTALALWKRPC
eukprot:407357-Pleurochrysis_carterae.AAC.4